MYSIMLSPFFSLSPFFLPPCVSVFLSLTVFLSLSLRLLFFRAQETVRIFPLLLPRLDARFISIAPDVFSFPLPSSLRSIIPSMISLRYHRISGRRKFSSTTRDLLINHRQNRYYGIINDFILAHKVFPPFRLSFSRYDDAVSLSRTMSPTRGVRELNFSSLGFYGRERDRELKSLNQSRMPIITPFRNFINDSISRRRNVIIGDVASEILSPA